MNNWLIFGAIVSALFIFDLFQRRGALARTLTYVAIALAFGAWIWVDRGSDDAKKFYLGYTLEMVLSLDNVFVISLIFGALSIPSQYRERVLIYGILGALVFRGLFIGLGTTLVGAFDWLLIAAGVFLIYTGAKLVLEHDEPEEMDLEKNRVLKLLKRFVPVTTQMDGNKLFIRPWQEVPGTRKVLSQTADETHETYVRERGKLSATPLFVALVLIEIADVIFAADSVPATLAVTTDPFLVYTSNIFAILGLRALFSVLENAVNTFEHLSKAVAFLLVFIGVKVTLAHTIHFEIGMDISLFVVFTALAIGVVASLIAKHQKAL